MSSSPSVSRSYFVDEYFSVWQYLLPAFQGDYLVLELHSIDGIRHAGVL